MNPYETWLRRLLCIIGLGLLVAVIPIFFPLQLMATIHQWLGLGEFPDAPITIYLARSTSLLYAVHGFIMLLTGWKYRELKLLAPVLGWLHVVMGLIIFGIDLTTGMPWYWTSFEGIPISMAGLMLVWLAKKSATHTVTILPGGSKAE